MHTFKDIEFDTEHNMTELTDQYIFLTELSYFRQILCHTNGRDVHRLKFDNITKDVDI